MNKIKGFCILFTAVLVLVLSSCFTGFFPQAEEKIDGTSVAKDREYDTKVKFNNSVNLNNVHKVRVFSDRNRESEPFGPAIPAHTVSDENECEPNSSYSFYIVYYLDINGVEIPFKPTFERGGYLAWPIPRNTETIVPISPLSLYITDPDEMLATDAYYFTVKNSGYVMFNLSLGINLLKTENGEENVMPGQTGVYRLTSASLSNLYLNHNVINQVPFPISSAARGKVYSFDFNGATITSLGETDITLRNSLQ